ncbi:DUF4427 domain-containing protein [Vibrio splendidus]|uniref:DUF4427 domain-containing protein n=1 Tax=Vibrio splendidus TaxID=29497 RepID=UPI0024688DE1|nr:DUF4427 domain-containing protein [Vibrio splendidus]MDH5916108.1 DUF4427 domain-containing protein [Vibrio splendidus]
MKNNIRFDLSEYLIHFFRDVDQESKSFILFPEHAGFTNLNQSTKLDALFLMRCALRHQKLCATWSYRNQTRAIYGKRPAICFTDMPLAAFLKTSTERMARGENIGQYALMLPKSVMFTSGSRPVIYALSSDDIQIQHTNNKEERIISPELLPLDEQYRYVTYNPSSNRPIDWTHEREWRWPYKKDVSAFNKEIEEDGFCEDLESYPGLKFSELNVIGAGILVHDESDIRKVLFDILTLVDRGFINQKAFKFIIQTSKLTSHLDVLAPKALSDLINDNIIDLSSYFCVEENYAQNICNEVDEIIKEEIEKANLSTEDFGSEYGRSWVWVVENQPMFTRALMKANKININKEGRYLVGIDEISFFPLRKQEYICKKIGIRLTEKYLQKCTYFSVMGKDDYDSVPFYTNFTDEQHEFYNSTINVD